MHLIQQHTFDIQCFSQAFGKNIQLQLSTLLEKAFYPQLEILLNKYDISDKVWEIDAIEITIESISKKFWKEELVAKTLQQIEDYLKLNQPKNGMILQINSMNNSINTRPNQLIQLLFFYLENGYLPINSFSNTIDKIIEEIGNQNDFHNKLFSFFENHYQALLRWALSVKKEEYKKRILISLNAELYNKINGHLIPFVREQIQNESIKLKEFQRVFSTSYLQKQWEEFIFWMIELFQKNNQEEALHFATHTFEKKFSIPKTELKYLIENVKSISKNQQHNHNLSKNIIDFFSQWNNLLVQETNSLITFSQYNKQSEIKESSNSQSSKKTLKTNEAFYINNAGLVLLHPFLERLFVMLGYIQGQEWANFYAMQKAILCMHFLVFGEKEIDESQLILNKILCGIDIQEMVNVQLELTIEEKEKCVNLLDAVLEHWKVLSSSSKEALQETFLQREGKLEVKNNGYQLWIKDHGADILLDQLPWGIGMIKTPWMEHYLECNWNH